MKYMDGWPDAFARLADVCFVVEDVELPCHSQLLARSSPFFAGMFENLGPQLNTTAPLRLEAPLRGVKLSHFKLFLHSVYCSPGDVEAAVASLALTDLEQFGAVCKLADKLDAGELRAALEKRAISAQEDKKLLQQDLLGWIQLADRWVSAGGHCAQALGCVPQRQTPLRPMLPCCKLATVGPISLNPHQCLQVSTASAAQPLRGPAAAPTGRWQQGQATGSGTGLGAVRQSAASAAAGWRNQGAACAAARAGLPL